MELIQKFIQHGIFLELGAGSGSNLQPLQDSGFVGMGIEMNPMAVALAHQLGNIEFEADARTFWRDSPFFTIVLIENNDGVLFQGVLANVVENRDVRRILRTADMALHPDRYLFIAEPIRWDDPAVAAIANKLGPSNKDNSFEEWKNRWNKRYEVNEAVGLPPGVFAVAKPGPKKNVLDWISSEQEMRSFLDSPDLERFARHVRREALEGYLNRLGLICVHWELQWLYSRNGDPLPGYVGVWHKKKTRFKYHPWYRGMTPQDRIAFQDERGYLAYGDPFYWGMYWRRLRDNLPPSHCPPKKLFHREMDPLRPIVKSTIYTYS